jgi:hypothetical protein
MIKCFLTLNNTYYFSLFSTKWPDVFNKAKCNKPFCNMEHRMVAASHIILMDSFSLPVNCD